ncbi:hypothetical protein [Peribacillus acanthi]|uniref:hypothetical protein n=1 Tax=Peribacillus acanthi TaxID=2171554 RepID=UPI00130073E2|nr:hypothetical protein [Peribacillus acanthi]
MMCQERQADEVLHLAYNESRISAILEHASVDVLCYDSFKKRTYAFECKYVSATRSPNVTFELSHQNGKVGWALDECTMNNYIVFFLQGVGAVLCGMKVFQGAVKRNLDTFNVWEYNDSNIVQVPYDWLISEAGGVFYTEEKLLHANAVFNDMIKRKLLSTASEVGAQAYKYTVQGMVEMVCANQVQAKQKTLDYVQ